MNYNGILLAGLLGWLIAQIIKFLLYFISNRVVRLERLTGSGGMPSSHSSMVCAAIVAVGRSQGTDSPLFAVTLLLGAIVMYDAMNVRWAAGQHAKALNQIFDEWEQQRDGKQLKKRLKEFLGHTPLEVVCGALLGIFIGAVVPV